MIYISLLYLVLFLFSLVGWIYNVVWTFQQSGLVDIILGVVGIFAAPIGAIHGLWMLF